MSIKISRRTYYLAVTAILVLAFIIREWFALTVFFPKPTQGDVSSYLRYALHLLWDGTFSQAESGEPVVSDTFRTPGYPAFLAVLYTLAGPKLWFPAIYQVQILLGTATVLNTVLIGRFLLGRPAALIAGLWMAFEPHNIAENSTILTETCLGFLMSSGLVCILIANRNLNLSTRWVMGSSGFFAASCLVNPVVALFPPLLFLIYAREKMMRIGLLILLLPFLVMAAWDIRGNLLQLNMNEMAERTLAFGSWPEFFDAWKYQAVDPKAHDTYQRISNDVVTMTENPRAGILSIAERMSTDPGRYFAWYFFQKPFVLWDWNVRMGAGGVNVIDTQNSPLENNALLSSTTAILRFVNPIVFFLALIGAVWTLFDRINWPTAVLFLYITTIYSIFTAEPRYSTPFRSIESVLAISTIIYIASLIRNVAQRRNLADPHSTDGEG